MNQRLAATVNGSEQASPKSWLRRIALLIHLAVIGLIMQSACFASSTLCPSHHQATLDARGLSTQSETYSFDAVGNRTQQVETRTQNAQTKTATTVYVYDINDRLLSAQTSGDRNQSNQYLYSAQGDLLKEIKDQNGVLTTTRFAYDAEHRLSSARVIQGVDSGSTANTPDTIAANETLLQYRYDPDGVLIGEDQITTANTTGTGGSTGISVPGIQSTDYAIDRSGAYPQIIEERDGQSGKLIASHTWGITHLNETRTQNRSTQCGITQDRINCNGTEIDQIANPQTSWLLQDHLGSTRALTDNQGILTDRFDYNSYGQLARHSQQSRPLTWLCSSAG